jgi:hypothetical protein
VFGDIYINYKNRVVPSRVAHSRATGYTKRNIMYARYDRWTPGWGMRLVILDYGWSDKFRDNTDIVRENLKRVSMKAELLKALQIIPVNIVRVGEDKNSPCGRITLYN